MSLDLCRVREADACKCSKDEQSQQELSKPGLNCGLHRKTSEKVRAFLEPIWHC